MKELKSLADLIEAFHKLPSVGLKSAERMAYSVLDFSGEDIDFMINSLKTVRNNIRRCPVCGIYTENALCFVCEDKTRSRDKIIVVSYPKEIYAFEKLEDRSYVYHILGGAISSLKGITPDKLSIDRLLERIDKENIREVVLATNPTVEGETTALYISNLLKNKPVTVSRLAYGLPVGAHLDYADPTTLSRSLSNRTQFKKGG